MNNFGNRRQTVGRARGVGDYVMVCGNVFVLVNTEHNCNVFVFGRGGNYHFLYAAMQVLFGVFCFGE
jgi:hypothetical protein